VQQAAAARPVRPVQTGRDDNHKVSPFFKNLNGGQVIGRETRFGVAEFSLLGAPIFPPTPFFVFFFFCRATRKTSSSLPFLLPYSFVVSLVVIVICYRHTGERREGEARAGDFRALSVNAVRRQTL
jgi:hypothetical protein